MKIVQIEKHYFFNTRSLQYECDCEPLLLNIEHFGLAFSFTTDDGQRLTQITSNGRIFYCDETEFLTKIKPHLNIL